MTSTRHSLAAAFALAVLAAAPMLAHHSIAAAYDDKKPVTLKGTVTAFEWTNPHVFIYLDSPDTNTGTNWAIELPSRVELKRLGWTKDSVHAGDAVNISAISARSGGTRAWARAITLGSGQKLAVPSNEGDPAPRAASSQSAPRWPDGHVQLGMTPGQSGYWASPSAHSLVESTAGNIRMNNDGLLANIADAAKVAPFRPWAKALYEYRQRNLLKDDPLASCLPPGGPRQFMTPFGLQIIDQPERQRIFVMSGGGNRNWRLIHLDGRAPQADDLTPTYFGDSVGQWEGDTLVIHAGAFNERFWMSNGGLPHTEALKVTERISRPDFDTLRYEVTIDDPNTYLRPWTSAWTLRWIPNEEIEEYYCDENNKDGASADTK